MKRIFLIIVICLLLCGCNKKNNNKIDNSKSNKIINKVDTTKDYLYLDDFKKIMLSNDNEYNMVIPKVNLNSDDASNINLEIKNDVNNSYKKYVFDDNKLSRGDIISFKLNILDKYLSIIEYKKTYVNGDYGEEKIISYTIDISNGNLLSNESLMADFGVDNDYVIKSISNNIDSDDSDYFIMNIKNDGYKLYVNEDNKLCVIYSEVRDDEYKTKELVLNN